MRWRPRAENLSAPASASAWTPAGSRSTSRRSAAARPVLPRRRQRRQQRRQRRRRRGARVRARRPERTLAGPSGPARRGRHALGSLAGSGLCVSPRSRGLGCGARCRGLRTSTSLRGLETPPVCRSFRSLRGEYRTKLASSEAQRATEAGDGPRTRSPILPAGLRPDLEKLSI